MNWTGERRAWEKAMTLLWLQPERKMNLSSGRERRGAGKEGPGLVAIAS